MPQSLEAVHTGDQVAIIKYGYIVQQGGPEEFITKPQGDYVSKFASSMPALGFMTAADLMPDISDLVAVVPVVGTYTDVKGLIANWPAIGGALIGWFSWRLAL